MIIDGLQCCEREEERCLSDRHQAHGLRECCANAVKEEALERVIVESAEGIRDVKTVVCLMELLVKPLVDMEQAVKEVLPGVDDEASRLIVSANN